MKVGELHALIRLDGADKFARDIEGAGSKFKTLTDTAKGFARGAGGVLAGTTAAVGGITGGLVKTGIEFNTLQQTSRAALTTITGSAEAANAQMDKLDEFASNSPFSREVFIKAQQQMMAFGIETDKVIPMLGAMQDATAAVGGSSEQIGELAGIFSKIQSSGKITAEDLNQLADRGVDAATLMGEAWGMTGGEVRDAISKGKIEATDAIETMTAQMTEKFGGASALVKDTWVGSMDRIKAAMRSIGADLAAPFVDPNGGGKAVQWANDFADVLRAVQSKVTPVMEAILGAWASEIDSFHPTMQALAETIRDIDTSGLQDVLEQLKQYTPIIAGLAGAFTAWGTSFLPFVSGLNPIVAGVVALALATPELRDGFTDLAAAAAPLLDVLGDLAQDVGDLAMEVITTVAPAFIDLAEQVVKAAIPLAGDFADGIGLALDAVTPIVSILGELAGVMSNLPGEVTLGALAFAGFVKHTGGLKTALGQVRAEFEMLKVQKHLGQLEGAGKAATIAAGGMRGLQGAVKGLGGVLKSYLPFAAFSGIMWLVENTGKINAAPVEELSGALADLARTGETTSDALSSLTIGADWSPFKKEIKTTEDLLAQFGDTVRDAWGGGWEKIDRALGDWNAGDRARDQIAALDGALADMVNSGNLDQAADLYDQLMKRADELDLEIPADELAAQFAQYNQALDDATTAQEEAEAATRDTNEALKEHLGLLDEAAGGASTVDEAVMRYTEQLEAMTEALHEGAGASAEGTREQRENLQSLIDLKRDGQLYIQTLVDTKASTEELAAAQVMLQDDFMRTATQMTGNREEAFKLAKEYKIIPKDVKTLADFDKAKASERIRLLKQELDQIDGRVTSSRHNHTIFMNEVRTSTARVMPGNTRRIASMNAEGSVTEFYNWGGLRENHVAQILPAGAWRVWAEPETGGEAYIPLAAAKRARSEAILEEVARRFGKMLIPMGRAFAQGGVTTSSFSGGDTGAGSRVTINQYISHAMVKTDAQLQSDGAATARAFLNI